MGLSAQADRVATYFSYRELATHKRAVTRHIPCHKLRIKTFNFIGNSYEVKKDLPEQVLKLCQFLSVDHVL